MLRFSVLGLLVAGCAAPAAVAPSASPPAPADPSPAAVSLAALPPVAQPALPAPLRPAHASTRAMDHGAHAAPMSSPPGARDAADAASPLARALDAYLAIQDALASDDAASVATQARAFSDAWARAVEVAPAADPHFWHQRTEPASAVGTQARALADAATLEAARSAFGRLSAPFAALVEAHGAPAGYDLARFTCGMKTTMPEGGVWLQRGEAPRNPYFGARMLTCATDAGRVSPPEAPAHGGLDHTGHAP